FANATLRGRVSRVAIGLRGAGEIGAGRVREQSARGPKESRRGATLVDQHLAHRVISECGASGVLCITPPRVVAQCCGPGPQRLIARITSGERRVDALAQRARPVGRRRLIEEDKAASRFALEFGPTRATRFVALVEESAREKSGSLLVIADDEPVLRRAAETEDQRRQATVDRLFGAVEDQRAHLVVIRWRLRI